jgi:hypothetical protein
MQGWLWKSNLKCGKKSWANLKCYWTITLGELKITIKNINQDRWFPGPYSNHTSYNNTLNMSQLLFLISSIHILTQTLKLRSGVRGRKIKTKQTITIVIINVDGALVTACRVKMCSDMSLRCCQTFRLNLTILGPTEHISTMPSLPWQHLAQVRRCAILRLSLKINGLPRNQVRTCL